MDFIDYHWYVHVMTAKLVVDSIRCGGAWGGGPFEKDAFDLVTPSNSFTIKLVHVPQLSITLSYIKSQINNNIFDFLSFAHVLNVFASC